MATGARRGRPAKPTALRILHGDQASRVNLDEPVPGAAEVIAPDDLTEEARAVWDRLAPDLVRVGVLTPWDVDAFGMLCRELTWYHKARALVDGSNVLIAGAAGRLEKNPALAVAHDCETRFNVLAARFGLTPSDRQALKTAVPGASRRADDSHAAAFLTGG